MNAPEHHFPLHKKSVEIDLRDIALEVFQGWKWIASCIAFCVTAGIIYILFSTPQYSSSITYAPAPDGLLSLSRVPGTSFEELQPYKEFSQKLSSYENFKAYYSENPDAITVEETESTSYNNLLRKFFFDNIKLRSPTDRDEDSSRSISLEYDASMDGPQLLNEYFRWTEERYIQTLTTRVQHIIDTTIEKNEATMEAHLESAREDASARIARLLEQDRIRIAELEDQLEAEKQSIISSREERIRLLQDAEQIASRLGIEKPTTPAAFGRQAANQDILYAEINSQDGVPLYFMGTAALRAEKEVIESNLEEEIKTAEVRDIEKQLQQLRNNQTVKALMQRENFAAFSDEYNNLRAQNGVLASSIILEDEVDIAVVNHWAYQPESPDSPRSTVIIALSLVLGGMLGLTLLFLSRFSASVQHHRQHSI